MVSRNATTRVRVEQHREQLLHRRRVHAEHPHVHDRNLDTTIGSDYIIEAGTLAYGGSGTNTIESLDLFDGTTFTNTASSVTITGPVTGTAATLINANTLTLAASNTINVPTITQNSGTLTINHNQTIPTLTFAGGVIAGTGDLTVTDAFTWTAGHMTGAGTFTLASGASGTLTGTASKEEGRNFTNNSVISWNQGALELRTDNPTGHTTFTNNGFIAPDITQNSLVMQWSAGTQRPAFVSNNTASSSFIVGASAPSTHTFTISNLDTTIGSDYIIEAGTLAYGGSGTNTIESLDLFDGTTFTNTASSVTITGPVTGTAATLINADTLTLAASNTINVPTITQNSGTLTINHNQTIPTLTFAGGVIAGTGDLTVTDAFTWTAGHMTGAGTFTLASGASGTLTGTASKEEGRNFTNNSVISWNQGALELRTDNPTGHTTFTNNGFIAPDITQNSLVMQWSAGTQRPAFVSNNTASSSFIVGASAPSTHTFTISRPRHHHRLRLHHRSRHPRLWRFRHEHHRVPRPVRRHHLHEHRIVGHHHRSRNRHRRDTHQLQHPHPGRVEHHQRPDHHPKQRHTHHQPQPNHPHPHVRGWSDRRDR